MEQIGIEVNPRRMRNTSLLHSLQDDGIVVQRSGWDGDMAEPVRWPFVLRDRIGDEGVAALMAVQKEWKEDVLTTATDRFERRLVDECAKLRIEMAGLRVDLKGSETTLSQAIAASRTEILRWSFAFWIGQVVAIVGLFLSKG